MSKLLLLTLSLALVGCDEKPVEPTKTVDHFLEDKADREGTLKVCQNNPGELKNKPNCVNATAAEIKASSGHLTKDGEWWKK